MNIEEAKKKIEDCDTSWYCKEAFDTLLKENERLNNIINELEKKLLEWHEYWEDDDSYSWQYKDTYDYLQELKGDGNSE